jgi:hypothetical protein
LIYLENICPVFSKGLVKILKPGVKLVLDTSLEQPAFIIPGEVDKSIQVILQKSEEAIELEIEIYFTSKKEPLDEIPIEFLYGGDYDEIWVVFSDIRTKINYPELIILFSQLIANYENNPKLEEFTIE